MEERQGINEGSRPTCLEPLHRGRHDSRGSQHRHVASPRYFFLLSYYYTNDCFKQRETREQGLAMQTCREPLVLNSNYVVCKKISVVLLLVIIRDYLSDNPPTRCIKKNPLNPYPNPQKPPTHLYGYGFLRVGYGLSRVTPGLPVMITTQPPPYNLG